jgi:hypothetical protein
MALSGARAMSLKPDTLAARRGPLIMPRTHADAIALLEAAGVPASRRDWAMGNTIAISLGHPSTRDGIAVYPGIAWLVPSGAAWSINQPVGQLQRALSFPNLAEACNALLAIARAFTAFRACDSCKRAAQLAFGERLSSPEFWVSLSCVACGARVESDGTGSLPDDLRALELIRNGTWAVSVARPTEPAQWAALRRELRLGLPELAHWKESLPGSVFAGTFAEASRIRASLGKVLATELRHPG